MARIYLRATNLQFRNNRASRFSIQSVELDVRGSQLATLEGESGSGKSSLLGFILGDQRLEADTNTRLSFEIGGRTLDCTQAKSSKRIGYLGDQMPFLPWCSVSQSIARQSRYLGLRTTRLEVERDASLNEFGLDSTLAKKLPNQLSFGQRRRFALFSVLRYQPEVLLIDEIFKGLDARNSEIVSNIVVKYVRQKSAAAILALHEPRYVEAHADARYALVETSEPLKWQVKRVS